MHVFSRLIQYSNKITTNSIKYSIKIKVRHSKNAIKTIQLFGKGCFGYYVGSHLFSNFILNGNCLSISESENRLTELVGQDKASPALQIWELTYFDVIIFMMAVIVSSKHFLN